MDNKKHKKYKLLSINNLYFLRFLLSVYGNAV